MPVTVDEIIERLGGAEAAARLTGVGTEAVRKWRQAHAIPSRHWPAVIAATGLVARRPVRHAADGRRAQPWRSRRTARGATAALVLADGSGVLGPRLRRPYRGRAGRRGVLQHRHDRLSGDPDRPSYAGQIITFTFPHIGNVGANPEDLEATNIAALRPRGEAGRDRALATGASHAASRRLAAGARRRRASPASIPARSPSASATAARRAAFWRSRPTAGSTSRRCGRRPRPGRGWRAWTSPSASPARRATSGTRREWRFPAGTGRQAAPRHHVVAVDYGAKRNILRCLASAGCRVTVLPATATAEDILRHRPGRRFPLQRPRRPGGDGGIRGAGDPGRAGCGAAAVRHLPRPSVAGSRAGRADLQARPRPSRRQPAGQGFRQPLGGDRRGEGVDGRHDRRRAQGPGR